MVVLKMRYMHYTVGGRNSAREIYSKYTTRTKTIWFKQVKRWFDVCRNVLIETKIYDDAAFFDSCVKSSISGLWHVWQLSFIVHIYLKNDAFKMCSRKRAKCKMTAKVWEHIMCSSNSVLYILSDHKNLISKLRRLFRFLCLVNLFYRRYVSHVYNISNICPIYFTY